MRLKDHVRSSWVNIVTVFKRSKLLKDEDAVGRIIFMAEPKAGRTGYTTSNPLCTLNLILPKDVLPDRDSQSDLLSINKDHSYLHHGGISKYSYTYKLMMRINQKAA